MTAIPHKSWVLVCDSEKALVLYNEGDEEYPNLQVMETLEQENPPTHEQGSDRPGRFNDGPQVQRSAVDDADWHEQQKDAFARQITEMLYDKAHKGDFDKLIVAAPPEFLGDLRGHFHTEVESRIVAEIHKGLTHHPVPDIEKTLKAS